MQNRRTFIKTSLLGAGCIMVNNLSAFSFQDAEPVLKFTILHTNDTHSRLEPFPDYDKRYGGMGGIARRSAVIKKIRQQEEHVLLFDAGDIFQGTPYFNLYKGEPEIKAMSMMQYDASTMGNHDFDAGIEGFAKQLPHATFPFLVTNYNFNRTILADKILPYKIFQIQNIKIGVYGLGIQLKGLVPDDAYGKIWYNNPIQTALKTEETLKLKKGCDMIVCLSHLGFEYDYNKVSDKIIAKETKYTDLIIGGHTHTFLATPHIEKNKAGNDVIINQVGWGGIYIGRLDFTYTLDKKILISNTNTVILGKQTST